MLARKLSQKEWEAAKSLARGLSATLFEAVVEYIEDLTALQRKCNDMLDGPDLYRGQGCSRALSELAEALRRAQRED